MLDLLGTIGEHDIAYTWIQTLFGDDPSRPLSSAFAVFTSSLVFLGAMLMGWHVLIGIVNSAYTGKVLGERWHQIWAPLRVVMGFGMLVPIGGGFSAVHHLLQNVIGVVAVNLGNAPIKAYIAGATDRSVGSKVKTTYGSKLALEFLKKEICFNVVDQLNAATIGRYTPGATPVVRPSGASSNTIWPLTATAKVWPYLNCGSITFNVVTANGSEVFKGMDADLAKFNEIREEATTDLMKSVRDADFFDYEKIAKMLATNGGWNPESTSVEQLADNLIAKGWMSKSIAADLSKFGETWNDKVSAASAKVFETASVENGKELRNRIDKYGFMVAGSYERSLSSISGMAVSLASSAATVQGHDLSSWYSERLDKALELLKSVQSKDYALALTSGIADPSGDDDWIPWLLSKVFGNNLSNAYMGKTSTDPVGDMMAFGHSLLNTASLAIIGMTGAALIAGGLSNGVQQAPSVAFYYLSSQIGWIVMTFIVVGFLYAFVMPMMPMIMVFVMGVTWLILFLEAAIAAVIWAFAFIRMDGSEFFDRNQAPGVTLLFNLILRPALGMLAYCGMLLLQPVLLNSLALIWSESFSAQTGGSLGGLVWVWQFVFGLVLYLYLQWQLMIRLTGLIPSMADRVGSWVGMQMHGYNDGQETSNMLAVVAPTARAASQSPMGTIGKDAMQARQQSDAAKRDQQRQEREAEQHAARMQQSVKQEPNQNPAGAQGGGQGSGGTDKK